MITFSDILNPISSELRLEETCEKIGLFIIHLLEMNINSKLSLTYLTACNIINSIYHKYNHLSEKK